MGLSQTVKFQKWNRGFPITKGSVEVSAICYMLCNQIYLKTITADGSSTWNVKDSVK